MNKRRSETERRQCYLGIIAVSNSVQGNSLGGFTLKVIKRPDEGFVNPMLYDQRAILQPSSRPPYFLSPTSGIRRCVN